MNYIIGIIYIYKSLYPNSKNTLYGSYLPNHCNGFLNRHFLFDDEEGNDKGSRPTINIKMQGI